MQGGCYCGAIRYEVTPPAKFVAHCHCENCRRAHGAAFVTYAGFLEEQFALRQGEELLSRYQTETQATRSFCSRCGTTLFFSSPRWAGEVHVTLVSLHEPHDLAPKGHAYFDRHVPWLCLSDDLPKYGGDSGTEAL